jgi:hypothetical protein
MKAHALQDAIKVDQPGGPGKFDTPKWCPLSQKKVRDALIVLGTMLTEWLELHGAALSAARRNPDRQMEIPRTAAGRLRKQP